MTVAVRWSGISSRFYPICAESLLTSDDANTGVQSFRSDDRLADWGSYKHLKTATNSCTHGGRHKSLEDFRPIRLDLDDQNNKAHEDA